MRREFPLILAQASQVSGHFPVGLAQEAQCLVNAENLLDESAPEPEPVVGGGHLLAGHRQGQPALQLRQAGWGEREAFSLSRVVAGLAGRANPAPLLQPGQRRVDGARAVAEAADRRSGEDLAQLVAGLGLLVEQAHEGISKDGGFRDSHSTLRTIIIRCVLLSRGQAKARSATGKGRLKGGCSQDWLPHTDQAAWSRRVRRATRPNAR